MRRLSINIGTGRPGRWGFCLALLFLVLATLPAVVHADTLVRGFKAKSAYEPGWVVAISKSASDTVEAAPSGDPGRIYGVVIDPSDAPATINRQGQQVFVATSGNYPVLVSDQNGAISPGDYLALSVNDGIAAKATSQNSVIVGRALESFNSKQGIIASSGGFAIGRVKAAVSVQRNPLLKNDLAIPSSLRHLGEAIAGKPVSAVRIYGATLVFLTASLVSTSLIWVSVRSAMVAIGRNPLSRHSIFGGLGQAMIVSALIFIIGLFGVYLLLKL